MESSTSSSTQSQNYENDWGYLLLVEFAHKHLDFQLPELISILDMNGIGVDTISTKDDTKSLPQHQQHKTSCRILPLPNEERYKSEIKAAHRRAFVILEFSTQWYNTTQQRQETGISNDSRNIATLLSRCVLVKRVIELWGYPGATMDDAVQSTRHWIQSTPLGKRIYADNSNPLHTWKVTIHTLGSKYTREEQDVMRKTFAFLDLPGKVQMTDPTHEFLLIREIEMDSLGSPLYPRYGHLQKGNKPQIVLEHDQRPPLACYFGRILAIKTKLNEYDLKKRSYLGPTSMDAELSFVMSNFGQVQQSSVVLDPFVGTGSILVSCALRGAYCVGTDIDWRVLRGRNNSENIYSNFKQYGLPRPDLIRSDNAIYHRHFACHAEPWVDAIVTDPPYGIRAGAKKSGSRLQEIRPVLDEHRHDHIAQTKPYNVADVMADLLDVAARVLVMDGRLVYVIPSYATDFDPAIDLPKHNCLEIIHISYQPFTMELGRRIVTMKKTQFYDSSRRQEYLSKVWINGAASAEKCANIRDKIMEAAKLKPGYEKKARYRKQKRLETKQAKKRAKFEGKGSSTP